MTTNLNNLRIVHTMNEISQQIDLRLIEYQVNRLQELIGELHNCCKDRFHFEAKKFNLPQAELKCISLFDGHKYLTGVEIAGMLEVAKSRATVILDSLEKKGLVQRMADPNDARVKLACLTPEGQRKVLEIEEFLFGLHREILDQIEPVQRGSIIAALETLRTSMKAMKAKLNK